MLTNKIKGGLIAAAMLASLAAVPANATAVNLTADGAFFTFDIDPETALNSGLAFIDAQNAPGYNDDGSILHFVFNLTNAANLTVVDGGFAGDEFEVFDNGVSLGFTSTATNSDPSSVSTNFAAALADSNYSRGVFLLGAGEHDITGLLSLSATVSGIPDFNLTVGAVSLSNVSQVPVPAAFGLFLLGNALLGLVSRRRSTTN
ncbi:MAG: hypothetical protein WC782_01030 [Methylococcaceae bacterium]|jgi:hypothetical protein